MSEANSPAVRRFSQCIGAGDVEGWLRAFEQEPRPFMEALPGGPSQIRM